MNTLIIISCLIAFSFGLTINTQIHCSCSDYVFPIDCLQAIIFGCTWAETTCKNVECKELDNPYCFLYPHQCSLAKKDNDYSCTNFSSCSNLKGNTDQECRMQNQMCSLPKGTGPDCVDFKCSDYDLTNCPKDCFINGEICQATPNCSELTEMQCLKKYNYCSYNEGTCQKAICQFQNQSNICSYVWINDNEIQPCHWDNTTCVNGTKPTEENYEKCFFASKGAYHWMSSSPTSGYCKSCHEMILSILFVIIIYLA